MKRITMIVVRGLVTAALLFAGYNIPAQTASINTPVCGSLPGNTTWSLINSPYIVCNTLGVTVPVGGTLTIDPGVTVQFVSGVGNKLINVQGALVANGSITQTITLTGADPTPGSWGGISAVGTAISPALVNLNYVTLDYGGASGSYGAQVYADQAVITITHSLIQNSAGNGVYASINSHLDAHSTNFVGNGQNAIQLNQPSTDLLMTGLTASGNGTDGVRLTGSSVWHGQRRLAYPGIPYIVDGPMRTDLGDVLTIDPGNTLQFTSNGWLYIRGRLNALGTASEPITLTAQTKTPGAWLGLFIDGGLHQAVAQLDYVTIEYAGNNVNGGNIEVANGRLIVQHSIIRNSMSDGVRFDSNWGGSILESQIVSNTLYGVHNLTPARAVLATNNWWGDASGPQSDGVGCPVGLGAKVTAGVFYLPVLTSTNTTVSFPLSNAPILTLTPRRWFAPADGLTKIWFDITVRDGNGAPIIGRKVKLTTSLGAVTDLGITDLNGKTTAFLTSPSTGDAEVTASLVALPANACEGGLSPETKVTFTTPVNVTDLLPNAPASYFDGDIKLSALPVITGINTTISVKLTNPLTTPVTVDVSFGFAQAGIGLAFGPIKDIVGQVIPANSSVNLSAEFLPAVSGHYCVQVTYVITAIGSARALQPLAPGGGSRQHNFYAQQASVGSPAKGGGLEKTRNSLGAVNQFVDNAYDTDPFAIPLEIVNRGIALALDVSEKISNGMLGDPPRQDYKQIDLPHKLSLPPVQPGHGLSLARATALNELEDALAQVNALGTAANTALDRYGGASEANDLQWASIQAGALLEYNDLIGSAVITASLKIDNVINVAASEGITSVIITTSDVIAMQQHLASGFSAQEIADAHTVGLTDADIEAIRQKILTAKPEDLAGDLIPKMQQLSDQLSLLGRILLNPQVFSPSITVGAGRGLVNQPQAAGNTLVQVYNSVTTIQLSNPLTQTAQIDVSARRIDLPADWAVDVSPAQIDLASGEQTTVTVSVIAGSPLPQGSVPRVAVEGYAGSRLLGGVVIDIMVPIYAPFDGKLHVYLPLMNK